MNISKDELREIIKSEIRAQEEWQYWRLADRMVDYLYRTWAIYRDIESWAIYRDIELSELKATWNINEWKRAFDQKIKKRSKPCCSR